MAQAMHLTNDQLEALKNGEAVRLALPETGTDVVLIKFDRFEQMQELAEDRERQRNWLQASHESAVAWMKANPY